MKKYKHKIYVISFFDIKFCSRKPISSSSSLIIRRKPNEKGELRFLDKFLTFDDDLKIKVFNV